MTTRARTSPPTTGRWPLVAAGTALVATCYGLARFAYGLLAPAMGTELGVSRAMSGWVGSGAYVGYCVAILVSTVATARWGPRLVASAAGATAMLGMLTVAASTGPTMLAVGVLVAGSSTGVASPPLAQAVARWVAVERRDRSQTVVNAGTGLGVLASGPVAALLADRWRAAWLCFAVVAAVVTAWVVVVVPRSATHVGPDARAVRLLPPRAPGGARLVVVSAAMGLVSVATWTYGRDLAESVGGASPRASALLWVVLGAAGILAAAGGDVSHRLGAARSWRLLMLCLAGSTGALALWPAGAAALLTAGVFGASYIGLTGLVLVGATRVWPDHIAAGVWAGFLAIAAGQALGAPLVGTLSGHGGLTVAFGVVAAAGALAALLRFPDPDTGRHGTT
ncbi:MFS transporter [Phycicoccus sp. CSK15P-2]|uniref:MFS transporter n=1 Tax=Phycicoccus sp. CSK15P-2 TaxID=2807627 RepID=UPI00195148B1|nr:MFS transporter [Phycicoccus sp. CSK15P-2]MBM6405283.1 MFS transporter [Phycicoccus sp. CSK15P-2]